VDGFWGGCGGCFVPFSFFRVVFVGFFFGVGGFVGWFFFFPCGLCFPSGGVFGRVFGVSVGGGGSFRLVGVLVFFFFFVFFFWFGVWFGVLVGFLGGVVCLFLFLGGGFPLFVLGFVLVCRSFFFRFVGLWGGGCLWVLGCFWLVCGGVFWFFFFFFGVLFGWFLGGVGFFFVLGARLGSSLMLPFLFLHLIRC